MSTENYNEIVHLYGKCMEELKLRMKAIELIITKKRNTGFEYTNVEFVCLQYRKVFELIVLANLVSNKEEYAKKRADFSKDWNAKRILDTIEKLNPSFYPRPTKQIVDYKTKKVVRTEDINKGFLTKKELIEGYDDCSQLLHAENPFGNPKDLQVYYPKFESWAKKTKTLLNHHQIQLIDPDKQLFVLMQREDNGKVQVALFEKVEGQ